jgi:DNA-binding CsgD family transcriptional regulator
MTRANCDQKILDLVDLCYQAVEEQSYWQTVIDETSNLLGADAADVTIENHAKGLIDAYGSIGFDRFFRENYDEAYFGKNPWIQQSNRLPHCKAFSSEFEPNNFEKTTFYNEWLKPQGLRFGVGSTLESTLERNIHIGFIRNRSRQQFTETEINNLDRLLPHFRRTIRLSDKLRMAGLEKNNLTKVLDRFVAPIFLTDDCARIVLLNRAAERLLADGDVVRISRNRMVVLADKKAEEDFKKLFSLVINGFGEHAREDSWQFAIPRRPGKPLIASLTPVRMICESTGGSARCMIVINNPARDLLGNFGLLRDAYGLTEAEAKLASALAAGQTLAAYATKHEIGIGTVRWHLKNIQAKTGKHRIENLTALISSALSRTVE